MTKTLFILFLFFCATGLAQENEEYWNYVDTVLMETKLVQEIDNDNIYSLLIFSYINGRGAGEAKGFLVENNIPDGTIDNDLPTPTYNDSCDVRMEAQPYLDSLFIIKYKWRQSRDYHIDTCYLFHYKGSYIAFSKNDYTKNVLRQTLVHWYNGPTSTDERDVIRICIGEARRTIFCAL